MTVNIDQMRANADKLRNDIRVENRKFLVQLLAALGTAFAGGVAALGLVLHLAGRL